MNAPCLAVHASPVVDPPGTNNRAIVLAAGFGSRLGRGPKPLLPVAGVPLVVRILRTLARQGYREAVIVTGHESDRVRRTLEEHASGLGLELGFAHNSRYHLKNGVSALAARELAPTGGLLVMADHLVHPELVRRVRNYDAPWAGAVLGVDRDIAGCFDIDDATKVRTNDGRIVAIGKQVSPYDALDTGVFRVGPAVFEEAEDILARTGDCSLSEAITRIAERGELAACDVSGLFWLDVDTPEAADRAEEILHLLNPPLSVRQQENSEIRLASTL